MDFVIEAAHWLLAKSDPMLIICILILAFWQHRTSALIAKHLDPDNRNAHPRCNVHESAYQHLNATIDVHHKETREDIQGLSERIDSALHLIAEKGNDG